MPEFEIFLSAGSLAMDAFAASLGIGACLPSTGARRLSCAGRQPRPCSAGSKGPINAHSSSVRPIRSPKASSKKKP